MPEQVTGGRSGNVAMSESLPPMASTVLRNVDKEQITTLLDPRDTVLRDNEFAGYADLGELAGLAEFAQRQLFGDEFHCTILDLAVPGRVESIDRRRLRSNPSRTSFIREPDEVSVEAFVGLADECAIEPPVTAARSPEACERRDAALDR